MQKKWAFLVLSFLAAISFWLASTLPATFFDYDFDKFFKPDDEATRYFEKHRGTFGTDNDFVLIALVSHNGVFNPTFYEKLSKFTKALEAAPHVVKIISPSNTSVPVREPLTGSIFQKPVLTDHPQNDSLRVFSDPTLINNLFSKDTTAVSILIQTAERLSKDRCDELAKSLDHIIANFDFDGIHVAGRSIGQVVYINKIQGEFAMFMGIAVTLVIVLLFFMFRSFRGIVIPLVTVLLAVVWSIGILNLSGSGIGLLLNMLPPVIFVVGMSDAVHLYARYLEELNRGCSQREAIRLMTFDTGLATMLTSVTTAIGFASLYFTGIPTLQEFGLLTAAGVLAAYIIAIAMMPAWLSLTSPPTKALKSRSHANWDIMLEGYFPKIIRYRRAVIIATIALSAIFAVSTSQLELNNYLLEDLRPKEKLRQDFTFFDQFFAGVRPFEIGLKLKNPDAKVIDREHMLEIEKIEGYLRTSYGVAAINSVVTVAKTIHRSYNSGRNEYFTLPENEAAWSANLRELNRVKKLDKMGFLIDSAGTATRIFGRVGDWGAQSFAQKNDEFQKFIISEKLDKNFEVVVTGTGTLIDRTNQNLVYSLTKGLGVAFLLISLIMGMMFKSLRMVVIALVPNLLPLLAVAAIMFYLGINLKMSTSIIFTIAFGIAVDDTIHLLSRYKLELMKGHDRYLALKHAFVHTGKALIITSIILFGGFISLCFSSFQSTFYIGLFVTLTLGFALIFDLILLPGLISLLPEKPSGESLDTAAK